MLRYIPLSLFLFSFTVHADTMDLSTALKEVIGDSPKLQASKASSEEAGWKKTEALGGFLPRLRMNGTYLTEKKYQLININFNGVPTIIPTIIPNSQFNLIAELPLFDGWISTNKYQAAEKNAEAADQKFEWDKFRTELQVTQAFYQALASKVLRDVALQNLKALEDHKREAQLFRKSGISTNYDVLRVEVQASNAKTDLADAEDEIVIAREKLAEILGHEKEEREPNGELPVPDETILSRSQKNFNERMDLKALRLESEAKINDEKAAGRFWVPEFSLFGQYTMYNNLTVGLDDYDAYRNARQVGFLMNWNLFDGMMSFSRAQAAIQRTVQSAKILRASELAANKDISIWERRYRSQCRIYQARMEDIKKSEESVRLAKEGRRVGARTESEILDAEVDLYRSRAGAVKAQLSAVEALINLQLAEGRRYVDFK
jgi:outer membrane protein TolC